MDVLIEIDFKRFVTIIFHRMTMTEYEIRLANEKDIQQLVDLLYDGFYMEEPIRKFISKTYPQIKYNIRPEKLNITEFPDPTFVCVWNNKVVGFCTYEYLEKSKPPPSNEINWDKVPAEVRAIRQKALAFARHFSEGVNIPKVFPEYQRGLRIGKLYVSPEHTRKGIGMQLVQEGM